MDNKKLIEAVCRYVITKHALPGEIEGAAYEDVQKCTQKLTAEKIINNETQKMIIRDTRDKEYRNLTVNKGLLKARYGIKI